MNSDDGIWRSLVSAALHRDVRPVYIQGLTTSARLLVHLHMEYLSSISSHTEAHLDLRHVTGEAHRNTLIRLWRSWNKKGKPSRVEGERRKMFSRGVPPLLSGVYECYDGFRFSPPSTRVSSMTGAVERGCPVNLSHVKRSSQKKFTHGRHPLQPHRSPDGREQLHGGLQGLKTAMKGSWEVRHYNFFTKASLNLDDQKQLCVLRPSNSGWLVCGICTICIHIAHYALRLWAILQSWAFCLKEDYSNLQPGSIPALEKL